MTGRSMRTYQEAILMMRQILLRLMGTVIPLSIVTVIRILGETTTPLDDMR